MYDDSTALMHMNANTLQKLIVGGAKDNDFSQLLIDSNGQNVVYPKLLILRMYLKNVVYVALENRPTFESTMVPFPRLERLTIEMVYPFGDDVVFRGNTETLKSIAIRTDEDALEMLINLKTLAQGRFLALRTFKLMSYIDALGSMRDLAKENITLIEGVNRQVENLQLVFSEAGRRLIGRINNGLAFDRLRQLDVCETYMSIRDVLRMLKMLPHLQRLRSKLAAVSMFHTMAQNAQSVDSFCEKNMRSGVWLQQWDIFYGDVSPIARYSSIYAAFLAVICPHFACLKVQHKTSEKHYAGIALLQRTTFSAHAQSLQRLLSL
ncbi:hypothetical protein EV175_001097 [Coemansia sp. RSA 1933]|nr:hypothetical protein EV175_001097 [Coemansia sp. RSA 1933]